MKSIPDDEQSDDDEADEHSWTDDLFDLRSDPAQRKPHVTSCIRGSYKMFSDWSVDVCLNVHKRLIYFHLSRNNDGRRWRSDV